MPRRVSPLPVVVNIGFSGSRRIPSAALDDSRVAAYLDERIGMLMDRLGLYPAWVCGISQIAVGGDLAFTDVCAKRGFRQRLFLPQTAEDYLGATDPDGGTPDFTAEEEAITRARLRLPHIIQEHVASHSDDREERFEEANLEILAQCDVFVCLIADGSGAGRAGSRHFLAKALEKGKPTLEIRVSPGEESPIFEDEWHDLPPADAAWAPSLPSELMEHPSAPSLPPPAPPPTTLSDYLSRTMAIGNEGANELRQGFQGSARFIVYAHGLATTCATVALVIDHTSLFFPTLLGLELLFLGAGFNVHRRLHDAHRVRRWACLRLAAEIARSVDALPPGLVGLDHLFHLPIPEDFLPLLRTMGFLRLASGAHASRDWEESRGEYLRKRVDDQIGYYGRRLRESERSHKGLSSVFSIATVLAWLATATKLILSYAAHGVPLFAFGFLAVILPVIAVGALSLAASHDLEARNETYQEMIEFLQAKSKEIASSHSEREFVRHAVETERRLLGEILAWASRRSFTNVA